MALTDAQLQILITAVDNASAGLASVRAAMASTEASAVSLGSRISSVGKSIQSFGSSMQSAGTSMTMGFTVPLALVGGASMKMASNFGAAMELIHTQAGASQQEVDSMSKSVLALAQTVPVGPEALAAGLYHVESLGLRGAQAMDVLKFAAEGAALSGSDLESTASALGAVIQSGIGGVNGYADAMGQLNGIVGAGNMRMQDLVDSMSSGILGVAREFGVSLKDIGASMDVMADSGVPAIQTATRLRMTLPALAGATTAAAKGMKLLGLGQTQIANDMRSPGGLMQALQDLKAHLDAYTSDPALQADILSKMFGGGRSSSVILGLINQLPLLQQKLDMVSQQGKTFGQDFAAYLGLPQAKWKQFVADVQVDAIKLGNALLPMAIAFLTDMQPVLGVLSSMVDKFQNLPGPVQAGILAFVGLLAVLGPTLFVLGGAAKGVGDVVQGFGQLAKLKGPVTAALGLISGGWDLVTGSALAAYVAENLATLGIIAGITLLIAGIAALIVYWDQVWPALQAAPNALLDYFQNHWDKVIVDVVLGPLGILLTNWTAIFNHMPGPVQTAMSLVAQAINPIISVVQTVLNAIIDSINMMIAAWNRVSFIVVPIIEGLIFFLAGPLIVAIVAIVEAVKFVYDNWQSIWSAMKNVAGAVVSFVVAVWDGAVSALETTWGAINSAWDTVWGAIAGPVESAFSAVESIASSAVNAIIDLLNGLLGKIAPVANFLSGILSAATGGSIDFNIPSISHISLGSLFTGGGGSHLSEDDQMRQQQLANARAAATSGGGGMPGLPTLPPFDLTGLGGGGAGGGTGGAGGKGSALSQAQLDMMALAQAFDAFHQKTQGTIFDFQVLLKIGSDQADLDKRAAAAGLALAAANMEALNSGFQLKKGLVEIAEYMVKTGETLTEVFRDIAQKAEDSLNSAFNALFNRPTREGAALQLQIDTLQQQEDQLKASGATQSAIDAVQKQIDQLNQEQKLRQDAINILKDKNTLADATLLTDQQQQFAATLYTIAIDTQSHALKSLSDQATLEALARFNLINAMNEHADALRAGLTSGASGGSATPALAPPSRPVTSNAPAAVTGSVVHNYIQTVEIHGDPTAGLSALGVSI